MAKATSVGRKPTPPSAFATRAVAGASPTNARACGVKRDKPEQHRQPPRKSYHQTPLDTDPTKKGRVCSKHQPHPIQLDIENITTNLGTSNHAIAEGEKTPRNCVVWHNIYSSCGTIRERRCPANILVTKLHPMYDTW